MEKSEEAMTATMSAHEGKYLTFVLCSEEYGIEILKVKEIMGLMDITPVPQSPQYVKGVINLRGQVIPVVDLRLKFGFEEKEYTKETCIIVVEVSDTLTGIIVDTVSEVLDVSGEMLEPTPHFSEDVRTDYFLGVAKSKEKVTILLDIEKVLDLEKTDSEVLQTKQ